MGASPIGQEASSASKRKALLSFPFFLQVIEAVILLLRKHLSMELARVQHGVYAADFLRSRNLSGTSAAFDVADQELLSSLHATAVEKALTAQMQRAVKDQAPNAQHQSQQTNRRGRNRGRGQSQGPHDRAGSVAPNRAQNTQGPRNITSGGAGGHAAASRS